MTTPLRLPGDPPDPPGPRRRDHHQHLTHITMQHIITDEEVRRFRLTYNESGRGSNEAHKAALTDFLANRPESTLGKLRSIAEMPETVPEGCERYFIHLCADGAVSELVCRRKDQHTHFIDIQLPTPDPEAEERQRFEELIRSKWPNTPIEWTGCVYREFQNRIQINNMWELFKLAKAK